MKSSSFIYKIASEQDEFEQINEMNYQTFVEEIPQHQKNGQSSLVDRFHKENTYVIAKHGNIVVGMIAIRANRPFSLDEKLGNLDEYLPQGSKPCEVRLLSVKKEYRKSYVFYKMTDLLVSHCLENQYNMALISGVEKQIPLYKRMGFVAFGSMTGTGDAKFQPMYLTKEKFEKSTKAFKRMMERKQQETRKYSFLPGPVPVGEEIKKAFSMPAISHRANSFHSDLQEVKDLLGHFFQANFAEITVGTGTLANDLVAAQISSLNKKGLILSNGEFGCRLIDHAARFHLNFEYLEKEWNMPISHEEISDVLQTNPDIGWLWTVHCETSTGYLYDLEAIQKICDAYGVELCVDACSSLGTVPANLSKCYLASAVSGKGLGSYPGLAIVLHRESIQPNPNLPRYLDLGLYQEKDSVPFTHSSNLVKALKASLHTINITEKKRLSDFARNHLQSAGLEVLGNADYSPGIITIAIPSYLSSREVGDRLSEKGILLSYESEYLLKKNWVQAAFMGEQTREAALRMVTELKQLCCNPREESVIW
ncbi:aminotransferase class V-fold PLP-dependent enzyme [Bacillus sp. MUM 13]|uniref:aminotransferase class V-fold PLP-dependent enzyme n=1 Tax=Bacillus sp. MUM 13 TaxID=1678001 RepID=UPI0008F56897|nr:aminotransferase class V-fold PLP-dependent enzyme [Bacillus sp. MUM 13]OIK14513.1 septum site-determining protein [Bacillus sp. MUM 13]